MKSDLDVFLLDFYMLLMEAKNPDIPGKSDLHGVIERICQAGETVGIKTAMKAVWLSWLLQRRQDYGEGKRIENETQNFRRIEKISKIDESNF